MKIEDFVGMLSNREVKALLMEFDRPPDKQQDMVSVRGYLVAPYRRRYNSSAKKSRPRNKKY